jgi:hypothetical protein
MPCWCKLMPPNMSMCPPILLSNSNIEKSLYYACESHLLENFNKKIYIELRAVDANVN